MSCLFISIYIFRSSSLVFSVFTYNSSAFLSLLSIKTKKNKVLSVLVDTKKRKLIIYLYLLTACVHMIKKQNIFTSLYF